MNEENKNYWQGRYEEQETKIRRIAREEAKDLIGYFILYFAWIVAGLSILFGIGWLIYNGIYDVGYNKGFTDAINSSMQNDKYVTFSLDGNSKTFYTAGNCPYLAVNPDFQSGKLFFANPNLLNMSLGLK